MYGNFPPQGMGWPGGTNPWGGYGGFGAPWSGYQSQWGYPGQWGFQGPMYGGGWMSPWATWGGTWAVPGPIGGLGGLRRHGGDYSQQYYGTGLPTDEEITEMVYDTLDLDPLVPPDAEINVDVDAGTVTLTGTVPNKAAKHAAGDDAWWAPGVVDVNNSLTVSGRRRVRSGQQGRPSGRQARTRGTTTG